jgi:hypothetical protein
MDNEVHVLRLLQKTQEEVLNSPKRRNEPITIGLVAFNTDGRARMEAISG